MGGATLGCFEPSCSVPATDRRPVRLGRKIELMWTCERHAAECVVLGCRRPATDRLALLVDGHLERVRACQKHVSQGSRRRLRPRLPARRGS